MNSIRIKEISGFTWEQFISKGADLISDWLAKDAKPSSNEEIKKATEAAAEETH